MQTRFKVVKAAWIKVNNIYIIESELLYLELVEVILIIIFFKSSIWNDFINNVSSK